MLIQPCDVGISTYMYLAGTVEHFWGFFVFSFFLVFALIFMCINGLLKSPSLIRMFDVNVAKT